MSDGKEKASWLDRLKATLQPRQDGCCTINFEPLEEEDRQAGDGASAPGAAASAAEAVPNQVRGCCGPPVTLRK